MAKEPEERFASAEELVEAVQDAVAGKTAVPRPPERKAAVKSIRDMASVQVPTSAAPPWRRALPWILAGLLVGLAVLLVYGFWPALSTALSSVMRPSD